MTPQPSGRAADETRGAIASARLFRAIADLRWDLLVLKTALRLHRRYDPNQPRVPAGSAEGGQWTSGGATSPREMSGRRGTPLSEATHGQLAALAAAQAAARSARARVKEVDPIWRGPASVTSTVEGRLIHLQEVVAAAEARIAELQRKGIGPGPFAVEWLPARGPERNFRMWERNEGDRMGYTYGCHTCGSLSPGTASGHYVLDHQNPVGWYRRSDGTWRLYPQCLSCSRMQGGYVSSRRSRDPE